MGKVKSNATTDTVISSSLPGIAIILNAWEELTQPIHQECFDVTLNFIDSCPSISTVILAATHVPLNKNTQGPNRWYNNSELIFVQEQGVDWIRRFWQLPRTHRIIANHNIKIRDHDYQGKLCLAIWEQWELEYLLNHHFIKEQNIWFFGSGPGVRRDPMGWGLTCDLIKHKHVRPLNIMTHKFGITENLDTNDDFTKSDFAYVDWSTTDWKEIEPNIMVKSTLDWCNG